MNTELYNSLDEEKVKMQNLVSSLKRQEITPAISVNNNNTTNTTQSTTASKGLAALVAIVGIGCFIADAKGLGTACLLASGGILLYSKSKGRDTNKYQPKIENPAFAQVEEQIIYIYDKLINDWKAFCKNEYNTIGSLCNESNIDIDTRTKITDMALYVPLPDLDSRINYKTRILELRNSDDLAGLNSLISNFKSKCNEEIDKLISQRKNMYSEIYQLLGK